MNPTRVKICGITRPEDAEAAVRAGADALGFNFWPGSKRYVHPEAAQAIIATLPPFVTAVGVFVDQRRAEITAIARQTGIALVQLHGNESPDQCRGYPWPVVKAFRVGDDFLPAALARYRVRAYLLDAPAPGFGGSGTRFDWTRARDLSAPGPVILAGGLTPENVAPAVAAVRPYAVDVASGVESTPGVKDPDKLARFVRAVRSAGHGSAGEEREA